MSPLSGSSGSLRLLFIATRPEPGGAASHLATLAQALVRLGHEVTVVATPGPGVWDALSDSSGVTRVAATFQRAFDAEAMRTISARLSRQAVDHLFAVFEPDYWGALRLARRHRTPVSLFLHHAGMKRANRWLLPAVRPTYLVPSHDLREWLTARRNPAHRVHVLPNPIDTHAFLPDEPLRERTRQALGFAPTDVVVGFAGRLEHNKGIVPFAKAINQAMQCDARIRALWVGSGRRTAERDALVASGPAPDRHVCLPWSDDMRSLYTAMDLLALPSTGRESFGRVLAEAQSCELPVLGSAIGGIPMALDDGVSGELVAAGDVPAWTDAIVRLAADATRRRAMGRAGRTFVEAQFASACVAHALTTYVKQTAETRALSAAGLRPAALPPDVPRVDAAVAPVPPHTDDAVRQFREAPARRARVDRSDRSRRR